MFAIGAVLLVVLVVLWRVTSRRTILGNEPAVHEDAVPVETLDLLTRSETTAALVHARSDALARVLVELFERMGLSRADSEAAVRQAGFKVMVSATESKPAFEPEVVAYRTVELQAAIERGLLVGIELARSDDDFAEVLEDALDPASLSGRADKIERTLFDEETRSRHAFYSRAAIVLQDMAQEAVSDDRRKVVGAVLAEFDSALASVQSALSNRMADVGDPNALQWGDAADRRLYYFKMGVTNSLRRWGRLDSLGHLYRYQGVNYDVVEAYDLAEQEVPALRLAEAIGIDRVLTMGPNDVRALVARGLAAPELRSPEDEDHGKRG